MPLELQPMQESDLDAFSEIMDAAFMSDIMGLMYPNGFNQADRDHYKASTIKKWRKSPDTINKMKVIDTDLPDDDPYNKVIGVSDWNIYPHERSEEELDAEKNEEDNDGHPPGLNVAFMAHFVEVMEKSKRKILGGRPYVYLHILATHPQHHRRGVGAMHLKWGFEKADELGLPVYLESSPMGRPLYARMGFEEVGWSPINAELWGAKKDIPHALMLRPAKTQEDQGMESDQDALLLEAVRRAGADGVVDLFHNLARIAFAQYGSGIIKHAHIRGLLAEQLAPSSDASSGSRNNSANGPETEQHQEPPIHPSRLQNMQSGESDDDDEYKPALTLPTLPAVTGADVFALGRSTLLNKAAKKAATEGRSRRRENKALNKTSKTAILELLLHGKRNVKLAWNPDKDVELTRLLCDALAARCDHYQYPIVFKGRHNHNKCYNFDPYAVDGLQSTITQLASSADRGGFPYRLEAAFKVFVRWNRKMFPEIAESNSKYAPTAPASLTSTLDLLRATEGLGRVPAAPAECPDFCWQLYNKVKTRVMTMCPSSATLQSITVGKKVTKKQARQLSMSLSAPTPEVLRYNFLATLEGCISDDEQTAEQLEERLEAQVFKLAQREPTAWPDLFGGEADTAEDEDEDQDEDVEIKEEAESDAGGVSLSEEDQDEDQEMEDGTGDEVVDDDDDDDDDAEMVPARRQSLVCMFHLQGRCPWGDQCTADHP
ncbi:hypothetical protein LTR85_007782 [Meristemomyces frigidus]|nr:hypothetical protein LTR85_007782 [Meristemomyces frigidus]